MDPSIGNGLTMKIQKLEQEISYLEQENDQLSGMLNLEHRNLLASREKNVILGQRVIAAEKVMYASIELIGSATDALIKRDIGNLHEMALKHYTLMNSYVDKYPRKVI